jgi:chromate transporter
MIKYLSMAGSFLGIGAVSFGGGYAMLPLLSKVLIGTWLTESEFNNLLAISQATPGPFALNVATYAGFISMPAPYLGAFIATVSLAAPSFLLCLLAGHFFDKFKESLFLKVLIAALKPAAAALIIWAGLQIITAELLTQTAGNQRYFFIFNWQVLGIFLLSYAFALVKKNAVFIIIAGAALGFLSYLS